jgi:hypothetical protein
VFQSFHWLELKDQLRFLDDAQTTVYVAESPAQDLRGWARCKKLLLY